MLATVEALLRQVAEVPPSSQSLDIWIPESVTMAGQPVSERAAFAVVRDRLRQVCGDFVPVGFCCRAGGRLCLFERRPVLARFRTPPPDLTPRAAW